MTLKLTVAFVLSFTLAVVFGKFYIPWLRSNDVGQKIKENGPDHRSKDGTPTMGGVIFILATAFACLSVGFWHIIRGEMLHVFLLLFAGAFGAIGFLDDWEKIKKKQNLGLSAGMKFLLQLVVSLFFVMLMRDIGYVRPNFYVPFFNTTLHVPEWLYFTCSAFIIVGTVNAVNITDGIDGLAAGTSIPPMLFFVVMSLKMKDEMFLPGLFAVTLLAGLIGFLLYNYNPAKCFMGDTGSLFLGGSIAGLAYAFDMPLVLVPLGLIFLLETLSDIIQVGYFKLTHGKRVFRMAPFHHHLEKGGWSGRKWTEKEIFYLFSGISLVMAIISYIGVVHRFGA